MGPRRKDRRIGRIIWNELDMNIEDRLLLLLQDLNRKIDEALDALAALRDKTINADELWPEDGREKTHYHQCLEDEP